MVAAGTAAARRQVPAAGKVQPVEAAHRLVSAADRARPVEAAHRPVSVVDRACPADIVLAPDTPDHKDWAAEQAVGRVARQEH